MKAVVHIGAPKVGSSSIQSLLIRNSETLSTRGFAYRQNVPKRGSQFEYVIAAFSRRGIQVPGQDNRLRYHCKTLDEQLANSLPYAETLKEFPSTWPDHVALFSTEHALPWLKSKPLVREFDKMFKEVFSDVRYIAYVRGPEDFIASQYSEHIKTGHTTPFNAFVEQKLKEKSPYRRIETWLSVVGRDRLDVRLLDREWLFEGDLLADFCHACGIRADGLEKPSRVNASLTASGAECLRALNRTVPQLLPDGSRNPLRANLIKAVGKRSQNSPRLSLNKWQKKAVLSHMGEDLKWLQEKFFAGNETLFIAKPDSTQALTPVDKKDMALDVLAELFAASRMGHMPELTEEQRKRSVFTPKTQK